MNKRQKKKNVKKLIGRIMRGRKNGEVISVTAEIPIYTNSGKVIGVLTTQPVVRIAKLQESSRKIKYE